MLSYARKTPDNHYHLRMNFSIIPVVLIESVGPKVDVDTPLNPAPTPKAPLNCTSNINTLTSKIYTEWKIFSNEAKNTRLVLKEPLVIITRTCGKNLCSICYSICSITRVMNINFNEICCTNLRRNPISYICFPCTISRCSDVSNSFNWIRIYSNNSS